MEPFPLLLAGKFSLLFPDFSGELGSMVPDVGLCFVFSDAISALSGVPMDCSVEFARCCGPISAVFSLVVFGPLGSPMVQSQWFRWSFPTRRYPLPPRVQLILLGLRLYVAGSPKPHTESSSH